MGFGDIIGRLWRRRGEQPETGRDATEAAAGTEPSTGNAAADSRESGHRETVDEQAGDSFLGYTD